MEFRKRSIKIALICLGLVLLVLVTVSCRSGLSGSYTGMPEESDKPAEDKAADDSGYNDDAAKDSANIGSADNNGLNGNGGSDEDALQNSDGEVPQESSIEDPQKNLMGYFYAVVNMPISDFELEDLNGESYKLSELKGKIVFLNFWATWCPPCREEMPHMQEFYEKYKDRGVVLLAVSPASVENRGSSDSAAAEKKVREFIEEDGYTFPVLLDKDDAVWSVYMQRGIPANYVIDAEGTVRYLKPGAFAGLEEMEAFLKAAGYAE